MDIIIPIVVALAIGWHGGIVWLVRSLEVRRMRPSLERLLRSAELDLLNTLRRELIRLIRAGINGGCRSKLDEVDSWLRRISS